MKRALIVMASVSILAVGVGAANAQYSSPPPGYTPPPAYSPSPAYNPSQGYTPSRKYSRRAYRRSARQTYAGGPPAYTPGSGPPPYSVPAQTYASQSSGPWDWYAGPGPKKRGEECVTDVDLNRGYGFRGPCKK
jgi:hypothetical protein